MFLQGQQVKVYFGSTWRPAEIIGPNPTLPGTFNVRIFGVKQIKTVVYAQEIKSI